MQKQNILKYTTLKSTHPPQNNKNTLLPQNHILLPQYKQQPTKNHDHTTLNYWKNMRVRTQSSQTSNKKTTQKSFLDKQRSIKQIVQFRPSQNGRKTFDESTIKNQKGQSEKVFKFVGNFVNINKNDSFRKQKVPDFFPLSSKERKSATKFMNTFTDNLQFKVQPTKFRQENIIKIGSTNIYFKQQQSGCNTILSPTQKSYLKRTVKTQTDEIKVKNQEIKTLQKPEMRYVRKSFNNVFRKTQQEQHSFLAKYDKSPYLANKIQKSTRNTQKIQLSADIYLKENKENRKTVFQCDEKPSEKFQTYKNNSKESKVQQIKPKSPQDIFSFLNKGKQNLQAFQKLNETASIFKKQRPLPQSDKKQARVNTQQNQKSPKPYFLTKKQQNKISFAAKQSKTINWQRDLIIQQKIGEGTFGKVFRATLRYDRSKQYALKRVMIDKKYKNREVEIVQELCHPQVMKVYGTFVSVKESNDYLNIVMDFYDHNLYEVINDQFGHQMMKASKNLFGSQKKCIQMRQKVYLYQLLKSLSYIHSLSICHRDIKPHNMLVRSWQLVLCDFGSAKRLIPGQPNLSYICSRCYRAPQLIFGSTAYTTQIDMWSVACVMLQMMNDAVPVFIGQNSLEHLLEVIKIVGTPSKEEVLKMNQNYDVSSFDLPMIKRKQLGKLFPRADRLLIDLVEKILVYDPERRLTAVEALGHGYFDEIRDKEQFNQLSNVLPRQILGSFFIFDNKQLKLYRNSDLKSDKNALNRYLQQLSVDEIRKILIPQWYRQK